MKSFLIIGLGKFGHTLCEDLVSLGNEVMIIDSQEEAISDLVPIVTNAKIGDCTNVEVLRSLGLDNFDAVFVCVSENFQSSLEITSLAKENGAKKVISRADRDLQAKFLLRNGADEIIYPDRDIAARIAKIYSRNNVFDYVELADGYGVFEIPVKKEWVNKSIIEIDFRKKLNINILGIKSDSNINFMPEAKYILKADEHLMVMAHENVINKVVK